MAKQQTGQTCLFDYSQRRMLQKYFVSKTFYKLLSIETDNRVFSTFTLWNLNFFESKTLQTMELDTPMSIDLALPSDAVSHKV